MDTLGEKVRSLRKEKGMSQTKLAEGICHVSTISFIESNKLNPKTPLLEKLAERLEVPFSYLVQEDSVASVDFILDSLEIYIRKGENVAAREVIDEIHVSRDQLLQYQMKRFAFLLADYHLAYHEYGDALESLKSIQTIIEHESDITVTTDYYNRLGNLYFAMNNMTDAYACYNRAFITCDCLDDRDFIKIKTSYNLAYACRQIGFHDKAIVLLHYVYDNIPAVNDLRKLADATFSLAIAYKEKNDFMNARMYLDKCLSIYASVDDIHMTILARQKYYIYIHDDIPTKIEALRKIAVELQELHKNEDALYSLSRAAEFSIDTDLGLAKSILETANSLYHPDQKSLYTAFHQRVLAKFHSKMENTDTAIDYAKKSHDLYVQIGSYDEAVESIAIAVYNLHSAGEVAKALELSMSANRLIMKKGVGNVQCSKDFYLGLF